MATFTATSRITPWHDTIPNTVAMQHALEHLDPTHARVVGTHHGLPVIQLPDGQRRTLSTTGRLTRTA
jgi:hypothetical protein